MKIVSEYAYFLPENINQIENHNADFLKEKIIVFNRQVGKDFNIIKFKDNQNFSLLNYKDLGKNPFPELIHS